MNVIRMFKKINNINNFFVRFYRYLCFVILMFTFVSCKCSNIFDDDKIISKDFSNEFHIVDLTEQDLGILNLNILNESAKTTEVAKARTKKVDFSKLKKIKVKYYNFDDEICDGELIVHASISEMTRDIFYNLFNKKYEIFDMNCYGFGKGNNNTCAFSIRDNEKSWHNFGLAIDINPLCNPYIEYKDETKIDIVSLIPDCDEAKMYINRNNIINYKHMIKEGDFCFTLFNNLDFKWCGYDYPNSKIIDYMHFEWQNNDLKTNFYID